MRRRQQPDSPPFFQTQPQRRYARLLERLQLQLSLQQALSLLILLALVIGICAGLVVIGFRQLSEGPAILYLPQVDDFESLPNHWRLGLPVAGALVLGLIFHWVAPSGRPTGVVHVLDRLHNHQGKMPMRNAILQFFWRLAGAVERPIHWPRRAGGAFGRSHRQLGVLDSDVAGIILPQHIEHYCRQWCPRRDVDRKNYKPLKTGSRSG